MLPPTSTLRPLRRHSTSSLPRFLPLASTSTASPRTFYSWHRPKDYTSHLDPIYQHFARSRTLRTRAKLIDKLRRHSKFNWDTASSNHLPQAFFTPRDGQLRRWASHWHGKGRWAVPVLENVAKKGEEVEELSVREVVWKQLMEAMRRRIERDPYEVVFGKRFEPFWNPLVKKWMQEDAGEGVNAVETGKEVKAEKALEATKFAKANDGVKSATPATAKNMAVSVAATKPLSYLSYASSTSWDSKHNKATRTEWDSTSGETRRFEYDPISNRMVQTPVASKAATLPSTQVNEKLKLSIKADQQRAIQLREVQKNMLEKMHEQKMMLETMREQRHKLEVKPVEPRNVQPVLQEDGHVSDHPEKVSELRKAIPIPSQTIPSAQQATRPAALASLPKNDLDFLTADDVRAKMGKSKGQPISRARTASEQAELEQAFDATSTRIDNMMNTMLTEMRTIEKKTQEAFHPPPSLSSQTQRLQTSVDRAQAQEMDTKTNLQSSLSRLGSKHSPRSQKVVEEEDADDAAAHESTEPLVAAEDTATANVPKDWSSQAELLQASRIQRTTSKRPYPYPLPSFAEDMEARKTAYEASRKVPVLSPEQVERQMKLAKANALLEAEVKEQKMLMQAHEGRYAHKLRSLRQELDTAYKQSSVHSDEFTKRIRSLKEANQDRNEKDSRYVEKIKSLRDELDTAYKQSSLNAEEHTKRIRYLEGELSKSQHVVAASDAVSGGDGISVPKGTTVAPGEGDMCANVVKYADAGRWYKQTTLQTDGLAACYDAHNARVEEMVTPPIAEVDSAAAQKERERGLVREVREVYEKAYGTIDTAHRQPDVVVSDELAEHDAKVGYGFKSDGLAAELVQREREAHEAQGRAEERERETKAMLSALPFDVAEEPAPVESAAPIEPVIPAETESLPSNVNWQEPPLYKVLAYDSGNDTFTQAVTTSASLGSSNERPISIPQALSQLYQPARFVPHFAQLQKDGYQVIYGTSDLLVFRKVAAAAVTPESTPEPTLVDHGLIKPMENALVEEAANNHEHYSNAALMRSHDPTSVENGKLMPYENLMAQEAANAYDAKAKEPLINSIDPTMTAAARFANPTGFVNHDPVSIDTKPASTRPAPKREEQLYSGSRLAPKPKSRTHGPFGPREERQPGWNVGQERHHRRAERDQRDRRRRRRRGAVKWVLSVGLVSVGLTYAIGVMAESARQARRERERWSLDR